MTPIRAIVLGIVAAFIVHWLLGGTPQTWWPLARGGAAIRRSAIAAAVGFAVIVVVMVLSFAM